MEKLNLDFVEVLDFHVRPFRAKFNPSVVWKKLDRYKNDPVGLKNYFRKFKTRIEFKPTKRKPSLPARVGGFYYPEEHLCEVFIEVNDFANHPFTDYTWKRLKFKLIQTAMHEFIHLRQFVNRDDEWSSRKASHSYTGNKRKDENMEYYSSRDEIEAYAHCVLMDYVFSNSPKSLKDWLLTNKSQTLQRIKKVFRDDTEQLTVPSIERLALTWQRRYNMVILDQIHNR